MSTERKVISGQVAAQANSAGVNRRGPLVEDTSVVGGFDEDTGAPVIRPRAPDGNADRVTEATDPRERHG